MNQSGSIVGGPTIVDADVHEGLKSIRDLLPHLDPKWHNHITQYGWQGPANPLPYAVLSGEDGTRIDWMLQDKSMRGSDLDLMRKHLFDGEQITVGILNGDFRPSTMQGWHELATDLATAYNDWQIAEWLNPEPRLRGAIHVAAHDPQVAAREIDRLGQHPQMVQAFLPAINDREYGDPYYLPIFDAAVRNDLAITLHHCGHTRSALGYPRYQIEWHATAIPQTMMCQLASMICNGVFDRFPELKVVVLESGFTWIPHFMWRMDEHFRSLRVEIPWVKRKPSDILRAQVRVSTQPAETLSKRQFLGLLEQMETDEMLVFSTDYPHWDSDSPSRALPASLSAELQQKIFCGNAASAFGARLLP
jgi:predicted TIM-barrel fold metal-dependent hydrolase